MHTHLLEPTLRDLQTDDAVTDLLRRNIDEYRTVTRVLVGLFQRGRGLFHRIYGAIATQEGIHGALDHDGGKQVVTEYPEFVDVERRLCSNRRRRGRRRRCVG